MIGAKTIESIVADVREVLIRNRENIDKAYLKAESSLDISIKVKIKPNEKSPTELSTLAKISFTLEKVEDERSNIVETE